MSQDLIPIYRMHQPTFVSPCILGAPCPVCALHASCQSGGKQCKPCRSGEKYECERARIARPAFFLKFTSALQLVYDGLATFIHRNSALRLNFEEITPLRGQSCRIDQHLIWQYAVGSRRALIAVEMGWSIRAGSLPLKALHPETRAILLAEAAKLAPFEHSAV